MIMVTRTMKTMLMNSYGNNDDDDGHDGDNGKHNGINEGQMTATK